MNEPSASMYSPLFGDGPGGFQYGDSCGNGCRGGGDGSAFLLSDCYSMGSQPFHFLSSQPHQLLLPGAGRGASSSASESSSLCRAGGGLYGVYSAFNSSTGGCGGGADTTMGFSTGAAGGLGGGGIGSGSGDTTMGLFCMQPFTSTCSTAAPSGSNNSSSSLQHADNVQQGNASTHYQAAFGITMDSLEDVTAAPGTGGALQSMLTPSSGVGGMHYFSSNSRAGFM